VQKQHQPKFPLCTAKNPMDSPFFGDTFFCHTQALAGGGGGDEAPPESGWMVGALQKIRGKVSHRIHACYIW